MKTVKINKIVENSVAEDKLIDELNEMYNIVKCVGYNDIKTNDIIYGVKEIIILTEDEFVID